jgi:hypothetical protein
MRSLRFSSVVLLAATVISIGCRKQELQCAPGDSPAVCKEVQQCFRSGTSIEVCREGEKDANAIDSKKSKQ